MREFIFLGMQIRKAVLQDLEKLSAISKATFTETFAAQNTEENMQQYLETAFSDKQLAAELSDPDSAFYFLDSGGKIAGYLKVSLASPKNDIQDGNALEIERIYVRKAFQGKKAGQMLLDKAIEIAKARKARYVWLGVWEHNPRAIRFYEKNGFVAFGKHLFKLGEDEQTDLLMKLDLL